MNKVLIVEDDELIAELERDYLEAGGFEVEIIFDGNEGLNRAMAGGWDALILDVMLPGKSGFEVCREVRKSLHLPVIMVTAKKEDVDKIRGLGLGADDYLVKPFGMMEMVSRVKAVLRRAGAKASSQILRMGSLEMNKEHHTVLVSGKRTELTLKEYETLRLFMENPGQVFTRDQLFDRIWGSDYAGESRTVDVHIGTLRAKLGQCGAYIETVRGVGYRMEKKI